MNAPFLKSEPGMDPIVLEGWFKATPERVFQAWVNEKDLLFWFGRSAKTLASAELDARKGGQYRFLFKSDDAETYGFEGEYLEVTPPLSLVFTWRQVVENRETGGREESQLSKVSLTLAQLNNGTKLKLVHEAVADDGFRLRFGEGWNGALTSLQNLLDENAS